MNTFLVSFVVNEKFDDAGLSPTAVALFLYDKMKNCEVETYNIIEWDGHDIDNQDECSEIVKDETVFEVMVDIDPDVVHVGSTGEIFHYVKTALQICEPQIVGSHCREDDGKCRATIQLTLTAA